MKNNKIKKLLKEFIKLENSNALLIKKNNKLEKNNKVNDEFIKIIFRLSDEGEISFSKYSKKCLLEFVNSKL